MLSLTIREIVSSGPVIAPALFVVPRLPHRALVLATRRLELDAQARRRDTRVTARCYGELGDQTPPEFEADYRHRPKPMRPENPNSRASVNPGRFTLRTQPGLEQAVSTMLN